MIDIQIVLYFSLPCPFQIEYMNVKKQIVFLENNYYNFFFAVNYNYKFVTKATKYVMI